MSAKRIYAALLLPLATGIVGGFGLAWDGMNDYVALLLTVSALIPLGITLSVALSEHTRATNQVSKADSPRPLTPEEEE